MSIPLSWRWLDAEAQHSAVRRNRTSRPHQYRQCPVFACSVQQSALRIAYGYYPLLVLTLRPQQGPQDCKLTHVQLGCVVWPAAVPSLCKFGSTLLFPDVSALFPFLFLPSLLHQPLPGTLAPGLPYAVYNITFFRSFLPGHLCSSSLIPIFLYIYIYISPSQHTVFWHNFVLTPLSFIYIQRTVLKGCSILFHSFVSAPHI